MLDRISFLPLLVRHCRPRCLQRYPLTHTHTNSHCKYVWHFSVATKIKEGRRKLRFFFFFCLLAFMLYWQVHLPCWHFAEASPAFLCWLYNLASLGWRTVALHKSYRLWASAWGYRGVWPHVDCIKGAKLIKFYLWFYSFRLLYCSEEPQVKEMLTGQQSTGNSGPETAFSLSWPRDGPRPWDDAAVQDGSLPIDNPS